MRNQKVYFCPDCEQFLMVGEIKGGRDVECREGFLKREALCRNCSAPIGHWKEEEGVWDEGTDPVFVPKDGIREGDIIFIPKEQAHATYSRWLGTALDQNMVAFESDKNVFYLIKLEEKWTLFLWGYGGPCCTLEEGTRKESIADAMEEGVVADPERIRGIWDSILKIVSRAGYDEGGWVCGMPFDDDCLMEEALMILDVATSTIIMSSPLGFPGATIKYQEIDFPHDLTGKTSYCGHPSTKQLLEALGASTIKGRYGGPAVGESFIAVPLQPSSAPREEGFTSDKAIESVADLRAILCTRIA